jgi:hypothetical protein
MRGQNRQGRFSINSERASIITGTTTEIVQTVGNTIDWWVYDKIHSQVDDVYTVGSSGEYGGRRWIGPIQVPTINAVIFQGSAVQNDRGFYNADVLRLTINMDVIEHGEDLLGSNSSNRPWLCELPTNVDKYLRDRIVFRDEVFTPTRIYPKGIITDKYTLFTLDCNQVNPEEMVNDPQFQPQANYDAYGITPQETIPLEKPLAPGQDIILDSGDAGAY